MKRSHSNSSSSKSTTTSSEIGISRKKIQENQLELGLKLQQSNRNRSFSSKDDQNHNHNHNHNHDDQANGGPISDVYNINISCCLNRDNNITTTTKSSESTINNINDANISNVSCIADCFLADNNNNKKTATAIVRGLQPFDVSSSYYYSAPNSFIKSSGEMATATMGYPFTVAQWKELERQAMIYKYMMASLPVPPDLLYSSFPANLSAASTFGPASYFMGKYGSGISVRWSGNNKDAEPGRCRRTDGKKWRCSRDVAPNQKYCERHMHRGRPRSRKHVEQQLLNQNHSNLTDLPINNNNKAKESLTKKTRLTDSVNTQSVRSCTIEPSKAAIYDQSMVSNANPFEDSRSLAWSDDQQWHQLMQSNVNSSVFQHQFEGEPLNLNSNAGLDCKTDLGLYERPLIDAWSIGDTKMKNHSSPLSGQSIAINEDMCQIHMGLGLIDSWVASTNTPGGPLAEVLGPGTASNQGMSDAGDGDFVTPPATAVSSPSGVLQKTLATFSDSSGNNSPICHHSRGNSDLPFHWLN